MFASKMLFWSRISYTRSGSANLHTIHLTSFANFENCGNVPDGIAAATIGAAGAASAAWLFLLLFLGPMVLECVLLLKYIVVITLDNTF